MYKGIGKKEEQVRKMHQGISIMCISELGHYFSGVCQDSHSSLVRGISKIIKIDVHFSNKRSFFRVFHPFNMPGSHPLSATFVLPIEIQVQCENQSSSMSCARDIQSNRLCSSLITWVPVIGSRDLMQQGVADQSKRVINSANEVSNPVM